MNLRRNGQRMIAILRELTIVILREPSDRRISGLMRLPVEAGSVHQNRARKVYL